MTPRKKRICCTDEACSIGKVCTNPLLRTVCSTSNHEMNSKEHETRMNSRIQIAEEGRAGQGPNPNPEKRGPHLEKEGPNTNPESGGPTHSKKARPTFTPSHFKKEWRTSLHPHNKKERQISSEERQAREGKAKLHTPDRSAFAISCVTPH